MIPPLELKVYPNPWGLHPNHLDDGSVSPTTDHEGRPAGANFFTRHYAGTAISSRTEVFSRKLAPKKAGPAGAVATDYRLDRQRTILSYLGVDADVDHLGKQLSEKEPVTLPVDHEYRLAVKKGLLIAADKETAAYCGVAFVDPKELLPKMEEAFEKARERHYGPGANEQFHARRRHFAKNDAKAKTKEPAKTGKDGN